jgi:hypothetical protein
LRATGAVPDVVAQVSFQEPGNAPGLGGDRPACQHAKRATGLELCPQGDAAPALSNCQDLWIKIF